MHQLELHLDNFKGDLKKKKKKTCLHTQTQAISIVISAK